MYSINRQPSKIDKKLLLFYISCIAFCIIAIFIAMYIQFFADENMKLAVGITNNLSDDEYQNLKAGFDKLFDNKLNQSENLNSSVAKQDNSKEIVFSGFTKEETTEEYDVSVKIPYINIDNEIVSKYNQDIKSTFEDKLNSIIENKKGNVIYTVEYTSYITDNVLSLMIRSNLKEGSNPQRVIIQTYNYDLKNNVEYKIEDALKMRNIDKNTANTKIQKEIKSIQEQVNSLAELGYSIFNRDPANEIYNVDNTTEFFIGNNKYIYLLYAYGNYNNTSEMDLVII